jgi:hypothetical protein
MYTYDGSFATDDNASSPCQESEFIFQGKYLETSVADPDGSLLDPQIREIGVTLRAPLFEKS